MLRVSERGASTPGAASRGRPRSVLSDLSVCSSDLTSGVTRVSSRSPTPRTGAGDLARAAARGYDARSQPKRQAALLQRSNGSFIPDESLARCAGFTRVCCASSCPACCTRRRWTRHEKLIWMTRRCGPFLCLRHGVTGTGHRASWKRRCTGVHVDDAPLRAFAVQALAPPADWSGSVST